MDAEKAAVAQEELPPPPISPGFWYSDAQIGAITLERALGEAHRNGCNFVCLPVCRPKLPRVATDTADSVAQLAAMTPEQVVEATSLSAGTAVVYDTADGPTVLGVLSEWIDCDAPEPILAKASAEALREQIMYGSHLGQPVTVVPRIGFSCPNLWCMLNQHLQSLQHMQFWVRVPLQSGEGKDTKDDTYLWWDRLRTACEHNKNLGIILEVTADLPDVANMARWMGEPVKAISFGTDCFLTNKKGQPVLAKAHQRFFTSMLPFRPQIIVAGEGLLAATAVADGGINRHLRYLKYFWSQQKALTQQDEWERPYYDFLQAPLQPLQDNLENGTYVVFEKDPVKYVQYEEAVYCALLDRPPKGDDAVAEVPVCIMVVGAGRGPLVMASLRAARRAARKVRVFAVEKNRNAVVYLHQLKAAQGWTDEEVTIVSSDMRVWKAPCKADMLVSELLGSFGDNELSPECLDGAQSFLKEDGISIPCEYTSYCAPVTTSKLHNEVKNYGDLLHFETPYVVKFHNVFQLAESEPCFTFAHPNRDETIDNTRYHKMCFKLAAEAPATIHGIAGFFDCKLYGDVHISINPKNFSTGMFSWFPLFFPIRWPVAARAGAEIEVHMWRRVDESRGKVWYEWMLDVDGVTSPIHNPLGRSNWIGL